MKKGSTKKTKITCNNKMMILMIICVLLSLATLSIVAYDKLIKNNGNSCQRRTNANGVTWTDCWDK